MLEDQGMYLYPSFKFYVSKFNLFRIFVNFIFCKTIFKMLYFFNFFYVDLLEAVSLFANLLVEIRSSTSGSPYSSHKRELFWSCCLLVNTEFFPLGISI